MTRVKSCFVGYAVSQSLPRHSPLRFFLPQSQAISDAFEKGPEA